MENAIKFIKISGEIEGDNQVTKGKIMMKRKGMCKNGTEICKKI